MEEILKALPTLVQLLPGLGELLSHLTDSAPDENLLAEVQAILDGDIDDLHRRVARLKKKMGR